MTQVKVLFNLHGCEYIKRIARDGSMCQALTGKIHRALSCDRILVHGVRDASDGAECLLNIPPKTYTAISLEAIQHDIAVWDFLTQKLTRKFCEQSIGWSHFGGTVTVPKFAYNTQSTRPRPPAIWA